MIRDRELAGLAMTLGRDAKITITVGGDCSFCTPDGSHINIARMPATPLGRMLMTGLVFHEIGHKNHTQGGRADGMLGDMMNVIEDIRVDGETVRARPGTCFNLEAVSAHYMNKGCLDPENLAQAMLGKVMAYGYGKVLRHKAVLPLEDLCDEMMEDAFGREFIDDVEAIIRDMPNLMSTADSAAMAKKLVELLIQQLPQRSSPSRPQQRGEGNNENGASSTSTSTTRTTSSSRNTQQESDKAAGTGGKGAGRGGGKRPTPEEIAEMLKNKTGYGDLSALIQAELNNFAESIPQSVRGAVPLLPVIGRLDAHHGKLNEVDAISASSRMRAKLMGLLQAVKRRPKSCGLSGRKLAFGRLAKLATGDARIFKKKIDTVEINTAVTVLLDLSGSMNSRYQVANAAAFALHTTLFGLKGVAVCSLEFSGKERQPEVNILVDFGTKPVSESFNHYPFDGTPTHQAIWAARAMLLQRAEPRKLMLLITDGCPNNSVETMAATKRTMKDGIEMVAIGIMDKSVQRFWENHRIISAIHELPSAMFGIMESLLL